MSTDADITPTDQTLLSGHQAVASGTVVARRYRTDRCLASGGYGDVWKGVEIESGRPIALKILRTDAGNNDPSAIARMRQEAEILKAMDHPNIVHVYGFGNSPYGHYLAMEFLDGLAIDQWLARHGPIESEELIPIVGQLLAALTEAHSKQILHRDLKPENIILVPASEDPSRHVAKLVDFGIAKAHRLLNESEEGATLVQTRAGGFMGTPRYAAPEQAVGDPCGPNIDLFALGLVIAEWLTGRMRIDGEKHADVMTQLLSPTELDISDCPYRWREWLARMIRKNPGDRYQSATDALKGLEELVVNLHQPADFLDDNPHVLPFEGATATSEGSFIERDEPLELDFARARAVQPTPAALRPFAASPAPPDVTPDPAVGAPVPGTRPLDALPEFEDEGEPAGVRFTRVAFLIALSIVVLTMLWIMLVYLDQ